MNTRFQIYRKYKNMKHIVTFKFKFYDLTQWVGNHISFIYNIEVVI